jgi:predicted transcriptional regulator
MLNRSANTATYGEDVAKIEITLPDDLLWQIDEAAERAGESRDAFLRRSVEEEVGRNQAQFRKELEEMWATNPIDLGGRTAAELIREGRDSR